VLLINDLFYITGNICRSPIAEAVFQNEVKKRGLQDQWKVESAAIIGYHTGKKPDIRARDTLTENGIADYSHTARKVRFCIFKNKHKNFIITTFYYYCNSNYSLGFLCSE